MLCQVSFLLPEHSALCFHFAIVRLSGHIGIKPVTCGSGRQHLFIKVLFVSWYLFLNYQKKLSCSGPLTSLSIQVSENLVVIADYAMLPALVIENFHQPVVVIACHFVTVAVFPVILLPESGKMFIEFRIEILPVAFLNVMPMPKQMIPYTFALTQYSRMPLRFSSVSLIKGRIGSSHTTVGIPFSFIILSTSKRSLVVQTVGSRILQRSSSHGKCQLDNTFDLLFMLVKMSKSLRIRFDFVRSATPKPYLSIISRHFLVQASLASICM